MTDRDFYKLVERQVFYVTKASNKYTQLWLYGEMTVDEITQEVVMRTLTQIDKEMDVPLLKHIVRCRVYDIARRCKQRPPEVKEVRELEMYDMHESVEEINAILAHIDDMEAVTKRCLRLRTIGYSISEISKMMDLTKDAVNSRLYKARQMLRLLYDNS